MERVAPIIDSHPSTAAIKERGLTGHCERILRMDCHRAAKQNAVDHSLWIWRSKRRDPRRCLCQVKSITGSDAIRDWPVLTASSLFELASVPACRFRSPTKFHDPAVFVSWQFFFGQVDAPTQGYERLERGPPQSTCVDSARIALILKPSTPSRELRHGLRERKFAQSAMLWCAGSVKQRIRTLPPGRFRKRAMVVRWLAQIMNNLLSRLRRGAGIRWVDDQGAKKSCARLAECTSPCRDREQSSANSDQSDGSGVRIPDASCLFSLAMESVCRPFAD